MGMKNCTELLTALACKLNMCSLACHLILPCLGAHYYTTYQAKNLDGKPEHYKPKLIAAIWKTKERVIHLLYQSKHKQTCIIEYLIERRLTNTPIHPNFQSLQA